MGFLAHTKLSTSEGQFLVHYFVGSDGKNCLVLEVPYIDGPPIVRIHSSCLFGEAFGSTSCDCKNQLDYALRTIQDRGGYLIYLFQEGRGIGLEGKMDAMELENQLGIDTYEAFNRLGHPADLRDYDEAIEALKEIGAPQKIIVITDNKEKLSSLKRAGFKIESLLT